MPTFDSFVIVLMAGIMVIGGGILIAMLALESPWWKNLGSRLGYVSTSVRRLRRRLRQTWSREKIRPEEDDQRPRKTDQRRFERTKGRRNS